MIRLMAAIAAPLAVTACQPTPPPSATVSAADASAAIAVLPTLNCRVADFQTQSADDRAFVQGNLGKRYLITVEGQTLVTTVTSDVFNDSSKRFPITNVTETQIIAGGGTALGGETLIVNRIPVNGRYSAEDRFVIMSRNDRSTIADNRWILSCVPA